MAPLPTPPPPPPPVTPMVLLISIAEIIYMSALAINSVKYL